MYLFVSTNKVKYNEEKDILTVKHKIIGTLCVTIIALNSINMGQGNTCNKNVPKSVTSHERFNKGLKLQDVLELVTRNTVTKIAIIERIAILTHTEKLVQ